MSPPLKERFISITVADFNKGERRFKYASDSLYFSDAKYFSEAFILVIMKLSLYIHTVRLDLHARLG